MNILIVGNLAREHALAWKLKSSPQVKKIFAAPGNAGIAQIATLLPFSTTEEIVAWLKDNKVDLVVVGADNYLAEGLVDSVEAMNILVFGPTKAAAQIEWSKSFAKNLMEEEGIPTAAFKTFTQYDEALEYLKGHSYPAVIKADGLALGKGVIIVNSFEEAKKTLVDVMQTKIFGTAGNEVVIEEFMQGREISIHVFCDGKTAVMFPSSQDHKPAFDGNKGPNTGGMGTISPVPWVTNELMEEIKIKIVLPVLEGLKKRGAPFKGLLYPGLMITSQGPKVVEFNARFGAPETESYMRLLESDLLPILLACATGNLNEMSIEWKKGAACCVILASGGYPGSYEKGKIIRGLDKISDKDVVVFHAATKEVDGNFVTNGGRVLGVTAVGADLTTALAKAYKAIETISFDGMQFRKDIGLKSMI